MMKKETGYPSVDKVHEIGYSYFERNPIIPNISFYNALNLISKSYKDTTAINCRELNVTYKELIDSTKVLSKAFKELGIKEKDIITVSMPSFYQAVLIFLAASRIGAVVSILNSQSTTEEIISYLNLFESPLFINYDKNAEYNNNIKLNTKVKNIITLNKNELFNKNNIANNGMIGYNDFLTFNDIKRVSEYYNKHFNTWYSKKTDSLILFTSGTTGEPKSVVLTNENILSSGIYMKNSIGSSVKKGRKCLSCVPFNYPYGFITSVLMTLLCGKEAILTPGLNFSNLSYFIKKEPNYIFGIPQLYKAMIQDEEINKMDLSFVEEAISGGDFLSPNENTEILTFFRKHGSMANICNGSGNAETTGANTNAVGIKYNPLSVGKPLVGTTIKIIDPITHKELKYGEEGLMCISGKHVFDRYFKKEEETKKVKKIDENGKEWYITDTYAKITNDGYVEILGRERRFFITFDNSGNPYKVYCNYVQEAIASIDFIEACAVVPKVDEARGYVPYAYIVLKKDFDIPTDIEEIIYNKCNGVLKILDRNITLKSYEIPSQIKIIDAIPYTNVANKVDYRLLEEEANSNNKVKKLIKE